MSVDIETPDFELKTAILLIKAKKFGYELPIDIAKLLAETAQDARTLEGLLLRLVTLATTTGEELTMDLAKRTIGGVTEERRSQIHVEDVIKYTCQFYNIKPTLLKGPKRDAGIVKARQVAMYLLKSELGLTLVEIGNVLGGRDHTTVMHGIEKIEQQMGKKERVSEDIMGITKELHG